MIKKPDETLEKKLEKSNDARIDRLSEITEKAAQKEAEVLKSEQWKDKKEDEKKKEKPVDAPKTTSFGKKFANFIKNALAIAPRTASAVPNAGVNTVRAVTHTTKKITDASNKSSDAIYDTVKKTFSWHIGHVIVNALTSILRVPVAWAEGGVRAKIQAVKWVTSTANTGYGAVKDVVMPTATTLQGKEAEKYSFHETQASTMQQMETTKGSKLSKFWNKVAKRKIFNNKAVKWITRDVTK